MPSEAWHILQVKVLLIGIDNVTKDRYGENLAANLVELSFNLISNLKSRGLSTDLAGTAVKLYARLQRNPPLRSFLEQFSV